MLKFVCVQHFELIFRRSAMQIVVTAAATPASVAAVAATATAESGGEGGGGGGSSSSSSTSGDVGDSDGCRVVLVIGPGSRTSSGC